MESVAEELQATVVNVVAYAVAFLATLLGLSFGFVFCGSWGKV